MTMRETGPPERKPPVIIRRIPAKTGGIIDRCQPYMLYFDQWDHLHAVRRRGMESNSPVCAFT